MLKVDVTPDVIAAAWATWAPRNKQFKLGPGPAFREAVTTALEACRPQFLVALAEAKAEGRRQGLEEAAKVCEADRDNWGTPGQVILNQSRRRILALASQPADQTRQGEP